MSFYTIMTQIIILIGPEMATTEQIKCLITASLETPGGFNSNEITQKILSSILLAELKVFAQAWEIFNPSQPITEERRWIAEFWE